MTREIALCMYCGRKVAVEYNEMASETMFELLMSIGWDYIEGFCCPDCADRRTTEEMRPLHLYPQPPISAADLYNMWYALKI